MSLWLDESTFWSGSSVNRKICPSTLFSHVSISSFPAGVTVFRGVFVVPCSPDSARGRFNDPDDNDLTALVALDGREVNLLNGLSAPAVGVLADWILILVFGVSAGAEGLGFEIVSGEGIEAEDFGLAGPASFSIRRRRI